MARIAKFWFVFHRYQLVGQKWDFGHQTGVRLWFRMKNSVIMDTIYNQEKEAENNPSVQSYL